MELAQPGHLHEAAGYVLLRDRQVPEQRARFAGSHGKWGLATTGVAAWQAFADLDDIIAPIAAAADRRLDCQNRHPI